MTKSRHDDDVQHKPYLAGLLRKPVASRASKTSSDAPSCP